MNIKSNKTKIIFLFIFCSTSLIITFITIDIIFFSEKLKKTFKESIAKKVVQKESSLKAIFANSENTLMSIRNSNIFLEYINNPKQNENIAKYLFLTIARNDLNIMQIRYIDANGLEKIRIDRNKLDTDAFVTIDEFLQNKMSRYYFADSKDKEFEKVWFSNIDLNMENGKVQIPFNPTLRAVLPIEKNGKFNGILIINYFMEKVLSKIFDEPLYDMILMNKKEYSLKHYNNDLDWSFYTKKRFSIKEEFPSIYKEILNSEYFVHNTLISKQIDIPTLEKLILIIKVNSKNLEIEKDEKTKEYIVESLIILILFLFISYIFSKFLNRLSLQLEDSEKYNKLLNIEVQERTDELNKSNSNLKKLNKNLEKAEQMSHLGHWRLNLKDKKFDVSNNLKNILGISLEKEILLSKFLKNSINHNDKKRVLTTFIEHTKESTPFKIEFKIKRKNDNEIRYVECNVEYQKDEDEKSIALIVTLQDITEFSLLQNELFVLRQAIEQAPISIIITDEKGQIEYINPHFTKVTSYSFSEIVGKNPRIFKSEYTKKEDYKELWKVISSGRTWSGKFKNIDKKGKEFWEIAFISPVYCPTDKRIHKYIAIKKEITKEVYLKKELQDKEEMMLIQSRHAAMGEMISMIAHQWRQPITVISMAANNILASIALDMLESEDLEKVANTITKQTEYLSQTIEDFRNFFKPNKEKKLVKMSTIFDDLKGIMGKTLLNNGIELKEEYSSNLEIMTNNKELLQVFINILKNAQEVFKEREIKDRQVSIKEYKENDSLVIEILDNAGGIDDEVLPRIFDPYFSTKNELVGTGLGLYMSKTIIEKHLNGTIEAFNKYDGACFKISLSMKNDIK